MKLGLTLGYSGDQLKLPVEQVQLTAEIADGWLPLGLVPETGKTVESPA